jgi:Flp pilus assembly protein protease CpaA
MFMNFEPLILFPTLLLVGASVFDIKTGRFPNWLFIASGLTSVGILFVTTLNPMLVATAVLSAAFLFLVLTPLFFMGALGAGDLKLLFVFCVLTQPMTAVWVLAYSLFWGCLMGLMKLAFAGELVTFTQSLLLRTPQVQNQKIPYTVALLLGWLTLLSLGGVA